MSTRNLTLTLREDLVRRARVVAAERDTSVSALVAGFLERLTAEADDYDAVWRTEFGVMESGLPMEVGPVTWSREDLHGR